MMIGEEIKDVDINMPKDAYDTNKQIPTFNAYLKIVVRDSQGKIIKVHEQQSHSPTANFIGLLLPLTYYTSTGNTFTITNTGGSTYSYQPGNTSINTYISYPATGYNANQTTNLIMIQVGSGSQSNPYNAYSLAAPIANGSGAGQLIYGTPSVSSNITTSGTSAYFYITQTLSNQSSSAVNITEVGIIIMPTLIKYDITKATNCGDVLVWYDVLNTSTSVPAGGTVTITYTFAVNS
jgi:hypothetical protein